jgi:lipoyl(octanoyl) transferase
MSSTSSDRKILFQDLGAIEYKLAWDYQEKLLEENVLFKRSHQPEKTINHLLFCEHPPVFTLGKSGKEEHLLINERTLQEKGIAFFHTNRGGDITFHGPAQIVGYPILDLEKFFTDIGRYLRSLEEVIILTLAEYGIKGDRSPGETGVWIEPYLKHKARKICAMGVRCSRWITMHGFALNVNTDLDYFNYIIPCGINDKQVTSIEKELGIKVSMEEVKAKLKKNFEKVFEAKIEQSSYLLSVLLSTESPI